MPNKLDSNDRMEYLPFVSVIVPVYNGEKQIKACIEALLDQSYSEDRYEIIIVDNGSTDSTVEIAKEYPVALLEKREIQSSYAARNKGIRNAKGEILAFTDSDCVAEPRWIEEGVKALTSQSADLVGGKVDFMYSKRRTTAELYDSVTFMQIESYIKDSNVAATANLFVKSLLFDEIGMFPESVKSGGDIQWTSRATSNGFSLVYAPEARVKHPTRRLKPLLKKQYRVGKGAPNIWLSERKPISKVRLLCRILVFFLPLRLSSLKRFMREKGITELEDKLVPLWFVSYLCRISAGFGTLASLHSILRGKHRDVSK